MWLWERLGVVNRCDTVCVCMQSVNELGVDGAKALVPALSEMKMLQSLNLESKWK